MRVALLTALLALALPGAAHAAALEPLEPCYVSVREAEREPVEIRGSGFTPGSRVEVAVDGVVQFRDIEVNAAGMVTGAVSAPHQRAGERPFTVSVTQQDNPQITVSATPLVTALRVRLRPRRAPSRSRVRFTGRGFTGPGPVYGHYVYGGRVRRTVRLAKLLGPCGTFSVRRRQIPIHSPRVGEWTLQVDQERSYDPRPAGVSVPVVIRVERVLRY